MEVERVNVPCPTLLHDIDTLVSIIILGTTRVLSLLYVVQSVLNL